MDAAKSTYLQHRIKIIMAQSHNPTDDSDLEEYIIERLLDELYNEKEQEYLDDYYERKNN
jgi:pyrroloquinoline quinone (PQQ) biosynthesis protein C